MTLKSMKSIVLIIIMVVVGSLISFLGLSRGESIARAISKPSNSNTWVVPDGLVLACTYTPVMIGIALILLSIICATILFKKWIGEV